MSNNSKNILHVITVSFVINHFFGEQFLYLKKFNNNKYFVACSKSEHLEEFSNKLGFKKVEIEISRSINPIIDIIAIYKLIKFIRQNNIHKVVGHTPKGGMVAMISSFICGISERIYFRHGIIYETSKGLKKILLKNIDRLSGLLATKVVCVNLNSREKNIILGLGTCNGIDTENKYNPLRFNDKSRNMLKRKLDINVNDFIVGYVGRIVKDKGIEELINAWGKFDNSVDNLKLLLVGPIEERNSISEATKKSININSKIIHIDFVEDATPYFSIMNLFILPTYREGFPTVSLEASSMNLPVLITKATGCKESIIDNVTGQFISHDSEVIKEKILFYYKNRQLAIKHGNSGREFVRNNFEQTKIWEIISKELKL